MSSLQLSFADQSEGMLRKVPRTLRKESVGPFGESVGSMAEVWINRKQTRAEVKLSPKESLPKAQRTPSENPSDRIKIDRLVDWQKAVDQLSEGMPLAKVLYKSGKQGGSSTPKESFGPKDIMAKIKMLFIQHLYNLSDPELSEGMLQRSPGTFGRRSSP